MKKLPLLFSNLLTLLFTINTTGTENKNLVNTQNHRKPLKILALIISSNDLPVYAEFQKIWRTYMHKDKEHIEAFFIQGNPHLSTEYMVSEDIIWLKTKECLIPGIINKTLGAFEAMLPHIHEFDYVIRANLSSFYVFDRLLDFLENCPKQNFYFGGLGVYHIGDTDVPFASGSGYILSSNLIEQIIDNKKFFQDNSSITDDVLMGYFLYSKGIIVQPEKRMDFYELRDWQTQQDAIPSDIFHFRVKIWSHTHQTEDLFIMSQLLHKFY